MNNKNITIVAGPCSIDEDNIREIDEIAGISYNGKPAIAGTRVVGLKSRTSFEEDGGGMGMDYESLKNNMDSMHDRNELSVIPPSVNIAVQLYERHKFMIATEIMVPHLQIPHYVGRIPSNKLLLWNPSVNQLGWDIMQMAVYAAEHEWFIGIKNGKWTGLDLSVIQSPDNDQRAPIEKVWAGLASYAGLPGKTILIHRGFDVPEKGTFRNLPIHEIASRVKQQTGCKLFFDPSHAYGPAMRDDIASATLEAMHMKLHAEEYLYDGVLIETGTSKTDTDQHISIEELKILVAELSIFRMCTTRE